MAYRLSMVAHKDSVLKEKEAHMPKSVSPIYSKKEVETLSYLKGKKGKIEVETSLFVTIKILELRRRFGHVDVLVTPCDGDGQKWIALHRVKV